MEGEEPTQVATQTVLDPRRVGKQNSGFSDEDVSDIICVLYPHSEAARRELQRLASENCPYIIGKDEADGVEQDFSYEDDASRFVANPVNHGNYAMILKLSSVVKDYSAGFAFGRHPARCDVIFTNDPRKRVSNIHFRIYVNEYSNVMIEDQSTNGTWVDQTLLTSKPRHKGRSTTRRWVLTSGVVIKIYLHSSSLDLAFRVRIPRRDQDYDRAYGERVQDYFARHGLRGHDETIRPNPEGHVDLFRPVHLGQGPGAAASPSVLSPNTPSKLHNVIPREWNGSGKYNKIGIIGQGAFAVVHRVTSKYDGRPYAAKEIEKRNFVKNGILDEKIENEMNIMQRVKHPHIVEFVETIDWENRLFVIIMEFISGGDVGKLIATQGIFHEPAAQIVADQLLNALGYLHTNNITHRDVKPDNILVHSLNPLNVKLTDFGLSKIIDTEQTFLRTFCGTLLYCAPEVYTEYTEYDENGIRNRGHKMRRTPGQRYSHLIDVWSLGGVLFYTLTGLPPYPVRSGISYSELLHKIMTTELDTRPLKHYEVSDQGIDFLTQMLQRRPEYRASTVELCNHMWLGNTQSMVHASQSYDEITDDEELAHPSCNPYDDLDRISDSAGEESGKENGNFVPKPSEEVTTQGRLFGEVGSSALGSSGTIPEEYLNLPTGGARTGESASRDSMGSSSGVSSATYEANRRNGRQPTVSAFHHQSGDQLQSLVEDVASQSLGSHESNDGQLPPANAPIQSFDFNSSKRKPPSTDTSEDFEDQPPQGKHVMKRLKSEGNIDGVVDDTLEEYKLLVQMPQVKILGSTRQVDGPLDKTNFWQKDRTTWHLKYPEMIRIQHHAFLQAAREMRVQFAPGKTPLWDLAMKYFPPSDRLELSTDEPTSSNIPVPGLRRDDPESLDAMVDIPSTAPTFGPALVPDPDPSAPRFVVPIQNGNSSGRAVGMIESHPKSCIKGLSIPITDTFLSFGRHPDNTQGFEPRTDTRVPKYAFRIVVWKAKSYSSKESARDTTSSDPPWLECSLEDANLHHFWISTKASEGVRINGWVLPSAGLKTSDNPAEKWTRLYDGDKIQLWAGGVPQQETALTFRCFWGGSSESRTSNQSLAIADHRTAKRLDVACVKAEKRTRDKIFKDVIVGQVKAENKLRAEDFSKERARSVVFEQKRQEAIAFLQNKPMQSSRRQSPASAPPTAYASRRSPEK